MRVDIVREPDDLHRETWVIQLAADHIDEVRLSLIEHSAEVKPTRRHKWQRSQWWYRYQAIKPYGHPVPNDVVQEAKDTFIAAIRAATVGVD